MARPKRQPPAGTLSPAAWREKPGENDVVEIARRFAVNLKRETDLSSIRRVAEQAGLSHSTLVAVINGRAWPDLETIAKIELGLGVDLWPTRASIGL